MFQLIHRSRLFFLFCLALCAATLHAGEPTDQLAQDGSLIIVEAFYGPGGILTPADDANFTNTSYLVVDYDDGSTPVTYGYRWNDANTTGETMLMDVISGTLGNPNGEELFAKAQTFAFGTLVVGLGHNTDGDSNWGDLSDGTLMRGFAEANGFLESVQTTALISSIDTDDSYQEGDSNFSQAWVYFDADVNPYDGPSVNWGGPADIGFSDRVLTNGSWDGWAFDLDTAIFGDVAPGTPETTTGDVLLGDINLDETVNFADITAFIAVLLSEEFQDEADCNEDEEVNIGDISAFIGILSGS